jgi:C4-dicarboxylate-specific signal transduction histidine kinase
MATTPISQGEYAPHYEIAILGTVNNPAEKPRGGLLGDNSAGEDSTARQEPEDSRAMIDRFSLRWRVPAIIGLILIAAVVTLSALAYGAAKRSALEAAHERLDNAARRVSAAAATGVSNSVRQATLVAADSAVVEALRNPGKPLTRAARAALGRVRTDTTAQLKVALLDLEGRAVQGVTPALAPERPVELFAPIDAPTVHPFHVENGVLEYVVAVPVRDSGRVIGQLVQWRRVSRVTTSLRLISELIGPRALLLIGNADGTAVTELLDTLRPPVIRDSTRAREARLLNISAPAAIPGTPWAFIVEYPYAVILRPLGALSWQSALVALGVVLAAIIAGALLSSGMTSSLADLTTTAEFIAGGDLTRRPAATRRRDEIGRLARSFGTMADHVRDSRDQLERRIEARTAALRNAMTRLRDTQDELVRKEKLATIGQLASSVGHELRNPLGVMSNAVYILERTIESPSPKVQEYLRLVGTQIKLSERIVADLLDSVRNQSPQRRDVDVRSLLSEQIDRVAIPSNVRVVLAVDEGLSRVHVDPDQVGQILVNLLTNAAQAMSNQPGLVHVHAHNGDGRVHIDVRDTGPGVPSELSEKIFEPLYTTKARGIGLGLSVSRSLASVNNGSLSVINHPDGGAVFTLELPMGDSE